MPVQHGTVHFRDTPETRKYGIAGGSGYIERGDSGTYQVIFTDPLFGPAGPYTPPHDAVELLPDARDDDQVGKVLG